MRCGVVVLAGGSGSRFGGGVKKQYLKIGRKPLLAHSIETFERCDEVDAIVVVAAAGDENYCREQVIDRYGYKKTADVVTGGKERYHSVYAGLSALQKLRKTKGKKDASADGGSFVLIHDGARPFVTSAMTERVLAGVRQHGACVCAVPVKDTIKIADDAGFVTDTPDRRTLYAMQTPQAFSFDLIHDAYAALIEDEKRFFGDARREEGAAADDFSRFLARLTDDAMVVEHNHPAQKIFLTEGSYTNIKITTPDDLAVAEALCHG